MRLSAFLLSMLMLVMILAPCRDHAASTTAKSQTQQLQAATPNGGQADDDCSPLCTCSCCASVSPSIHLPVIEALVPSAPEKRSSLYIAPDYQADRSAVWQPPRIG